MHDHRDHEDHKWVTTYAKQGLYDRTHQRGDSYDRITWRLELEGSHTWEQGNLWSPKVRSKDPAIAGGQSKNKMTTWAFQTNPTIAWSKEQAITWIAWSQERKQAITWTPKEDLRSSKKKKNLHVLVWSVKAKENWPKTKDKKPNDRSKERRS